VRGAFALGAVSARTDGGAPELEREESKSALNVQSENVTGERLG
jgi:hypothetical protein